MPIVNLAEFEKTPLLSKFQIGMKSNLSDNNVIEFLHELSREILSDPRSKEFADLMTVGFFCRKSSIKRCKLKIPELHYRRGIGTVTHIAPSNIPVNFAFSLLMGMISGNSNLVRIPSQNYPQVALFVELFDRVCNKANYYRFNIENIFFQSDHESKVLDQLIYKSHGLVVWGGDKTVNYFRSLSKAPNCVDIYFPNRISSSLISAEELLKCSIKELDTLCKDFYNDTYLVDQNACSSPNFIVWVGDKNTCVEAQKQFWSRMKLLLQNNFKLDPLATVDRIIDIIHLVNTKKNQFKLKRSHNDILRHSEASLSDQKMRYGTFLEKYVNQLDDITKILRVSDQTLTVYGFDLDRVFNICTHQKLYFDRIVKIGRALDMGMDWDGKNMLIQLSRKTQVG